MASVYLALAICFEVLGTIALKGSAQSSDFSLLLITIVSYILTYFLFFLSLQGLPLNTAYATWSAIGIALTALAGVHFFQEKIDLVGLLGLGFIIIGVVLINGFSSMGEH